MATLKNRSGNAVQTTTPATKINVFLAAVGNIIAIGNYVVNGVNSKLISVVAAAAKKRGAGWINAPINDAQKKSNRASMEKLTQLDLAKALVDGGASVKGEWHQAYRFIHTYTLKDGSFANSKGQQPTDASVVKAYLDTKTMGLENIPCAGGMNLHFSPIRAYITGDKTGSKLNLMGVITYGQVGEEWASFTTVFQFGENQIAKLDATAVVRTYSKDIRNVVAIDLREALELKNAGIELKNATQKDIIDAFLVEYAYNTNMDEENIVPVKDVLEIIFSEIQEVTVAMTDMRTPGVSDI